MPPTDKWCIQHKTQECKDYMWQFAQEVKILLSNLITRMRAGFQDSGRGKSCVSSPVAFCTRSAVKVHKLLPCTSSSLVSQFSQLVESCECRLQMPDSLYSFSELGVKTEVLQNKLPCGFRWCCTQLGNEFPLNVCLLHLQLSVCHLSQTLSKCSLLWS